MSWSYYLEFKSNYEKWFVLAYNKSFPQASLSLNSKEWIKSEKYINNQIMPMDINKSLHRNSRTNQSYD